MRMLSKAALVVLLALGAAAASHAQAPVNPMLPIQGTREVALNGNLSFKPSDTYSISGKYGPFITNTIQVAATVGFDKGGSNKNTTYGIEGNLHFPGTSTALPFIGVFLGGQNSDSGGNKVNTTAIGAQGGVKQFINSNVAATVELEYRHPSKKGGQDTSRLLFGLAIYLK